MLDTSITESIIITTLSILNISPRCFSGGGGSIPEAETGTRGGDGSIRSNPRCFSGGRRFSEEPAGVSPSLGGGDAISS
jgi:hypothetical protein